jgi:chemotaxis protein histidine kinase CheA
MLDVMVLSVLALTTGRNGGGENKIPVPLYRWTSVIEEGLRKEQAYQDEVKRLEEQLARTAELATQALSQAQDARTVASRERSGTEEMQQRAHQMELAAEKARASAELARREMELARQAADQARRDAEEKELRRAAAEQTAGQAMVEQQRLKTAVASAESDREQMLKEMETLQEKLLAMEQAQADAAAAQGRAKALEEERARLAQQNEKFTEKLANLSGQVASLEVQKESAESSAAQLEKEKQLAEEESRKSVWIRRDESLRRLKISYTEYNSRDNRNFVTRCELVMPLVQVGRTVLVPADFRKLGLARSFFGGLSDSVTQVDGSVSSLSGTSGSLALESIIVPGPEPQVCLVRFSGSLDGALQSISMETLKERRIKDALLFSPDEVNENGRVDVLPIMGSDYLTVRYTSGKKPKVGDYLLSDRGEFIGVMVTKEECYVMPQVLSRVPSPVVIPVASRTQDSGYFREFITSLNRAREQLTDHLAVRKF